MAPTTGRGYRSSVTPATNENSASDRRSDRPRTPSSSLMSPPAVKNPVATAGEDDGRRARGVGEIDDQSCQLTDDGTVQRVRGWPGQGDDQHPGPGLQGESGVGRDVGTGPCAGSPDGFFDPPWIVADAPRHERTGRSGFRPSVNGTPAGPRDSPPRRIRGFSNSSGKFLLGKRIGEPAGVQKSALSSGSPVL